MSNNKLTTYSKYTIKPISVFKDFDKINFYQSKKQSYIDMIFFYSGFQEDDTLSKLILRVPKIRITMYGLPCIPKVLKTGSREEVPVPYHHIRIPLDENQENGLMLKKFLNDADTYFSSKEFKRKIFRKEHAHKFEYNPIIKKMCRKDDDDLDDNSDDESYLISLTEPTKPDYCIIKFHHDNNHNFVIPFQLYNRRIKITNWEDLTKYVKYKSIISFNFSFNGIWVHDIFGMKNYGVSLYLEMIQIGDITPKIDNKPLYTMAELKKKHREFMQKKKIDAQTMEMFREPIEV